MLFLYRSLCEIDQATLDLFDRNACVSASALVGFDTRLGAVQQLFCSQTRNDDETKPGVYPWPGSFISHTSCAVAIYFSINI
jgi:hypothetical protein